MFLIAEGTPLDGSRTFYFNAARALVTFNDRYNVDLAYIFTQKNDRALPTVSYYPVNPATGTDKRALNAYDEQAAVVYGRGRITDNVTVEPYYIWKNEDSTDALRLNTYGARAVVGFGRGWKVRAEYALQSGSYSASGNDREANGGYAYIGRAYNDTSMKPSFDLGYATLSGDDPATANKVESWNPLFSRYPWTSELYSLTMLTEPGAGAGIPDYWTNINMLRAIFKLNLTQESRLELTYNILKANEIVTGALFSGTSKDRGELITAKLYHKFSPALDGYLLIETFQPGDFYAETNRDAAQFVRWELQWKI